MAPLHATGKTRAGILSPHGQFRSRGVCRQSGTLVSHVQPLAPRRRQFRSLAQSHTLNQCDRSTLRTCAASHGASVNLSTCEPSRRLAWRTDQAEQAQRLGWCAWSGPRAARAGGKSWSARFARVPDGDILKRVPILVSSTHHHLTSTPTRTRTNAPSVEPSRQHRTRNHGYAIGLTGRATLTPLAHNTSPPLDFSFHVASHTPDLTVRHL
jgi:hypothetical protein